MSFFHKKSSSSLPESKVDEEIFFIQRRQIIRQLGLGSISLLAGLPLLGCPSRTKVGPEQKGLLDAGIASSQPSLSNKSELYSLVPEGNYPKNAQGISLYPANPNKKFATLATQQTNEKLVQTYNNYYEFGLEKEKVWKRSSSFDTTPWTLEISGLVQKPLVLDIETLMKQIGLEERVYRFRCVEAWSMVVPWSGFPLAKLIKLVNPLSSAKYIQFTSVSRPEQMPGQKSQTWYSWPYQEGLRIDEATNELAFLATGIYGHPLTKQMGAPLRVVLPWKYGYKGPKALVKIEFLSEQPKTFWNIASPQEYGFYSNVNPKKPHPRWSQAMEKRLSDGKRVPTLPYNGYTQEVAHLYTGSEH